MPLTDALTSSSSPCCDWPCLPGPSRDFWFLIMRPTVTTLPNPSCCFLLHVIYWYDIRMFIFIYFAQKITETWWKLVIYSMILMQFAFWWSFRLAEQPPEDFLQKRFPSMTLPDLRRPVLSLRICLLDRDRLGWKKSGQKSVRFAADICAPSKILMR